MRVTWCSGQNRLDYLCQGLKSWSLARGSRVRISLPPEISKSKFREWQIDLYHASHDDSALH